jgi:hypothetical protein
MRQKEEEGRVKKRGVLLVKADLVLKPIPRVVEGIDFVTPKGFLVKRVESQSQPDQEA